MKSLTVNTLIKFRGMKTETGKRKFVNRLMKEETEPEEAEEQEDEKRTGGNYWSYGWGPIHTAYRSDDVRIIKNRKAILINKHNFEQRTREKNKYKCNIDILSEFENFDFRVLKPNAELKYLKLPSRKDSIITVNGVNIKIYPDYVYSFIEDGIKQVGAVWLIAHKGGFREGELGMYVDILYRYLKFYFPKGYVINTEFCTVLELVKHTEIHYSQIQHGFVPQILLDTINDFNKYL